MNRRRMVTSLKARTPASVKTRLQGPLGRLLAIRSLMLALVASGLNAKELSDRLDAAAVIDPDLDAAVFKLRNDVEQLRALMDRRFEELDAETQTELVTRVADLDERSEELSVGSDKSAFGRADSPFGATTKPPAQAT